MELLYVYADKVAQDLEGNCYVGSAFSQEVFDRYLQYFDHITMLMRKADTAPDDTEALSHMNRISSEKIDVIFLPNQMASLRNYLSPSLAREYRRIVIENITPERAVIVRAPSKSGSIAVDYCHKIGKPVLVEAVGCPWDSGWNHGWKGKILAPRSWLMFRRTMRKADYAIYVTSEFLQRRYPTSGKSAGVSDVELQPVDEAVLEKRLEKIRFREGKLRIGTAGALHVAYKGQRYVIEALAKLKRQGNTNFVYHLAGGGDSSVLQSLAKRLGVQDQVVFDGALSHDEMFAWLDALDVYVQPSKVEGMPRALIEAMSRGLPALGTRVGGIPELLMEQDMFTKGNSESIARMLSGFTDTELAQAATRNFEFAKRFQRDELELQRSALYSAFADAVKSVQL